MGLRAAPPSTAPPRITINVPCKLGWMKLSGYDNRGNTNSSMTLSVEVTKSHELKTIDFTKSITESSREQAQKMHAEVSAKATYAPVEASVSSGIEHSSVVKDLLSSTTELTREENSKLSITTKQDFTIGAGDQLHFYQRVFEGPGMSCKLEITQVSSDPLLEDQWDKVDMTVITRPQRFIDDLKIEYGENESDVSDHYVRELSGHSADINHGQHGKYAWLVPVWTYDVEEAATSFEICIQDTEQRGMEDMARGTGGKYRYIYAICDGDQEHRVVDAKLVRSSSMLSKDEQVKMLGKGWVGGDRDINEGRGGDFLYLAYKLF